MDMLTTMNINTRVCLLHACKHSLLAMRGKHRERSMSKRLESGKCTLEQAKAAKVHDLSPLQRQVCMQMPQQAS